MQFTSNQENVINTAVNWFNKSSEQTLQITGPAGSGKTTILFEILKRINIPLNKVAPMAYTGAASLVMRNRGLYLSKTIHSWLYEAVEMPILEPDGSVRMNTYFNIPETQIKFIPKDLKDIDLMIIDEASMVPLEIRNEVDKRNIKVLALGDLNQLPSIEGRPAYLHSGHILYLNEIMRQNNNSAIIYLADRAIKGLPIHKGFYGDVLVIDDTELTDQMILNSNVVICGKNKTRDFINNRVRHDLLGFNTDLPQHMERLVCAKNNWGREVDGINMVNGLLGRVVNYPSVSNFTEKKEIIIDFKPDMLSTPFLDVNVDYRYLIANHEQRRIIKNNKFYSGDKFEFAYAITTHKSQGSQFPYGIYISEYLSRDIQNQLDYTGITRFSNSLIYVIKSKKYY